MNVDAAYAIWRSCYDGDEIWLNTGPGRQLPRGRSWGCVGRWFAGAGIHRGLTSTSAWSRRYLRERIWEQPHFQEPAG